MSQFISNLKKNPVSSGVTEAGGIIIASAIGSRFGRAGKLIKTIRKFKK